jgi:hypothetical protein
LADSIAFTAAAGGRRLTLRLLGRPHSGACRDIMAVRVEAEANGFTGAFETEVWLHELQALRDDLLHLYRALDPSANVRFRTIEPAVELTCAVDRCGHVLMRVRREPSVYAGTRLEFEIPLDQSYLPAILRQLGQALEESPAE